MKGCANVQLLWLSTLIQTPSPYRFLVNKSKTNAPSQTPSSTQGPRFLTPYHASSRKVDFIEDASQTSDLEEILQEAPISSQASISDDEDEVNDGEYRQFKRRRLTLTDLQEADDTVETDSNPESLQQDEESIIISSPLLSSPPPVPSAYRSSTMPRFLPSKSTGQTIRTPTGAEQQATFLRPPMFMPSEVDFHGPHIDPLPDQFSPHRRGHRYITGGLSAEVQGWLVDLENRSSGHDRAREVNRVWAVKLIIDTLSSGSKSSMTLASGRQIHSEGSGAIVDNIGTVDVILAGEGFGEGLAKGGQISTGKIVGIKAPVWETEIDGRKWGVGVNWRVLN